MADMNVSIKGATDQELSNILYRLENESRVQELIKRIRRNSKDYNYSEPVSIDNIDKGVPLDKQIKDLYHADTNMSTSIKEAKDEDLAKILNRLRAVNSIQDVIRRIKYASTPDMEKPYMDKSVSTETSINELYHYGVKGMRWGRRKNKSGGYTKTGRRGAKGSSKKASDLSDDELRKKINRLNMEKQYKQLTSKQKSKGRAIVEGIMVDIGKEIAKDVLKSTIKVGSDPLKKAARKKAKVALEKAMDAAKKAKKG